MPLNASTIAEIDAAFAGLAQKRADALMVAADPLFFNRASQLVVLATRHALPALYSRREFVAMGGLMSYGPTSIESYRMTGVYTAASSRARSPAIYRFSCRPSSS